MVRPPEARRNVLRSVAVLGSKAGRRQLALSGRLKPSGTSRSPCSPRESRRRLAAPQASRGACSAPRTPEDGPEEATRP